jgi:hypothetical protein
VVQARRRLREAFPDALRREPLELDELDGRGAALPERAVVVERGCLTPGGHLLEGNVPDHEERAGAERADQMLDRRLNVLDDVAQVMNRAVEGVIGKGHGRSSARGVTMTASAPSMLLVPPSTTTLGPVIQPASSDREEHGAADDYVRWLPGHQ